MNMHPHVIKATRFIMKNDAATKAWGWELALGWVNWHACMGFMATLMDEQNKIVALGIVRPVKRPEDGFKPYEYDENGKHLFAEIHISHHPMGLPALAAIFSKRFGKKESVSFRRRNVLRTHKLPALKRNLLRRTPPSATTTASPSRPQSE